MKQLLLRLFYPWSKWVDIVAFNWAQESYLLQGRKNRFTNRKQFAIRRSKQPWRVAECGYMNEERLRQAGLWDAPLEQ